MDAASSSPRRGLLLGEERGQAHENGVKRFGSNGHEKPAAASQRSFKKGQSGGPDAKQNQSQAASRTGRRYKKGMA